LRNGEPVFLLTAKRVIDERSPQGARRERMLLKRRPASMHRNVVLCASLDTG